MKINENIGENPKQISIILRKSRFFEKTIKVEMEWTGP